MKHCIRMGMLALFCAAVSVCASENTFVPEKALVQKSKNHQVTVKDGVLSAANTVPGVYTNLHFNLAGMAYQPDLQLCFDYRVEIPQGGKVRYVGVAFDFKDAGATFNMVPVSAEWTSASLDLRTLKFHKKTPAKPGEAIKQLHLYCRMYNEAPGTSLLQVRNLRFVKASPASEFSASKGFVRVQKNVKGTEKDGVFTAENTVPLTSVPLSFRLNGMSYDPAYRMSFEYRSKVISGGRERYIGINFAHRTGGTTFSSFPASETWAKASIPLAGLKFRKAGILKKGEPLDRVTFYSRLDDKTPGIVRFEMKNVRFEKDPFYDAKAHVRLSYSALPLISWQKKDTAKSYTVTCSQNGKTVYTAECETPYFVPANPMLPGIYNFTVKCNPSGEPAAFEDVEIPALHHTWRMPEYDFAAFAARPRPRMKKLARYWNPDTAALIKSMKRTAPLLRIPPNPEPYKEGADPNIRSWVEWYGKVAGGIVSRTGSNLQKLGMAAVLADDVELKNYAKEKALIVARTWDPESGSSMRMGDLQAANLLRGLVWCYDGAYEVMTPEERKVLANCIRVRGDQFWKSTYPFRSNEAQNHPWDRAEAAAFAAVGLAEEPGMAMQYDYVANLYAYRILACLGFKGENNEGLKYWSYGFGLATRFIDVARYALNLSYYTHPWLKHTARFPLYGMPARGYILSFGDNGRPNHGDLGPLNRPFTGKLAAEAGDGVALWYAGYPERNGVTAKPPVDIPQSIDYEHLGIAIFNTFLADGRENVALGFHSGKFFAGHQHPDNNSFIINAYGDKLAIDGGYYDWYGSRHFKAYSFTTQAHNTVLVNGKGQAPKVPGGDGRMTGYFDSPNFGFVSGDASNPKLYMGELKKFDRDVLFLKPDFVAVYDRLAADKPGKFQWLLHSHSDKPMDYADGKFRFERPLAKMSGVMLLPEKFTAKVGPSYKVMPVLGYSETLDPDPQPEWTLTVENAAPAGETEFLSVMQIARSGEKGETAWKREFSSTAVAAVAKEAAVIFRRTASGIAEAGPFKTDARAAAVIFNADGSIYDAMMKDGSYLEYNGKTVLKGKGDAALRTKPDVEIKKVMLKVCGKDCPADYRVQRMAFGREVHMVSGSTTLEGTTIGVKIGAGTGAAPVSMILMQNERFLCGETGIPNVLFLNNGKLAFSFTSAKPFAMPELISLGEMKIREGNLKPVQWKLPVNAVKFEAENIASETLPLALVADRASASGGKASISWGTDGKRGTWKFTVPADGKYRLSICYATTYSRVGREILIDGKHAVPGTGGMVMRATGGFGYSPAEWRWCEYPVTIELKAGEHELTIANMYSTCNYDAFALIPVK